MTTHSHFMAAIPRHPRERIADLMIRPVIRTMLRYPAGRIKPSSATATRLHAGPTQWFDPRRHRQKADPPARGTPLSIAVVGAGLSGLRAAGVLADHGHHIIVFEKDKVPGGRMGSIFRGDKAVDAGAQYFTARDARFKRYLGAWIGRGIVVPWVGRLAALDAPGVFREVGDTIDRYVAVPGMYQLAAHLAEGLNVQFGHTVEGIAREEGKWRLVPASCGQRSVFDVVVLATPPSRALPLLPTESLLAAAAGKVRMRACWALMAVFADALPLTVDGLFFNAGSLSWAARNNSKPGRTPEEIWMLHSSHGWRADGNTDPGVIIAEMLAAFFKYTALTPRAPRYTAVRWWPDAAAARPLNCGCLWDADNYIGLCGDWCALSRVEGAFLSGTAMAGRILARAPEGA